MWVNIGDSYWGSGNGTNDNTNNPNNKQLYLKQNKANTKSNIKGYAKSLLGIPERLCIALTDKGWIRRNTVIWHKRNCLPSSVKDRFTNDFEYFYFFTKSPKYYFKQQFEPVKQQSISRSKYKWNCDRSSVQDVNGKHFEEMGERFVHPEGRNKRTVWKISTHSFKEAHFATFPERLIETPIDACCPMGGIVLDPFMGSGTVAKVAIRQGKAFIGIELNPEYIKIAEKRIQKQKDKMAQDLFYSQDIFC
jgi:site-specific DNA-methyltransferase (adenine-specific)